MKLSFFLLFAVLLGACSWVKPSSKSERVQLVGQRDVVNCVKKGTTTVRTVEKVWFFPRSKKKRNRELQTLAKNEAVVLDGDTIVDEGQSEDGASIFSIYKCY